MTASRIAAAAFIAVTASGCMSYRPVPPLDETGRLELARLAPRIAAERVRVVPADERESENAGFVAAAAQWAGATLDERSPSVTIEVHSVRSLEEPLLSVLSLGFLPYRARGLLEYQWWLVAEDGRQIAADAVFESPSWIGWLVGPVALLPDWDLSATWAKTDHTTEQRSDARRDRLALAIAQSIIRIRDMGRAP